MLVNTMVCSQLAANGLIKIQKLTEEISENTSIPTKSTLRGNSCRSNSFSGVTLQQNK